MHMTRGVGISLMAMVCFIVLSGAQPAGVNAAGVYDIQVTPLTTADCARCHTSHYNRLKTQGAKHSGVACTDCHQVFHAYNPKRDNYAAIMPKCSQCHDTPHGTDPAVTNCLACHQDPHQPLAGIADPTALEGQCRICHAKVAAALKAQPSKHTKEPCSSCHSKKHGRIPECSECHENHSPKVQMTTADCKACHPVHTPLQITYPLTQNKEVCGGCHAEAYNLLAAKVTKHTALTCAKCHPKHGYLPKCQECHGQPHAAAIHQKYAQCGACHSIAHNLQK